jgi:hypothetical protein
MWRRILLAAAGCIFASAAASDPAPNLTRKNLPAPTEIEGWPCDKGYVWYNPDGHLRSCELSHACAFGEAHVPTGSHIYLTSDGKPEFVFLRSDTRILGLLCRGHGHDYSTAFYPSGKLKTCWLAGDQEVQGTPCMGAGFFADIFGGGVGVHFHENGKLRTCKLSRNFGPQRRGEHFVQGP